MSNLDETYVYCKLCRFRLLSCEEYEPLDAHGVSILNSERRESRQLSTTTGCRSLDDDCLLYLPEERIPEFMAESINEASWLKGKIYCPKCRSKLGNFDFVSGTTCACNSNVVSPVHIMKSKVDVRIEKSLPRPISLPSGPCKLDLAFDAEDDHCKSLRNPLMESAPMDNTDVNQVHVDAVDKEFFDNSGKTQDNHGCFIRSNKILKHNKHSVKKRRRNSEKNDSSVALKSGNLCSAEEMSSCTEKDAKGLSEKKGSLKFIDLEEEDFPDNLICPICLDLLYSPFIVKPCKHIFCEPCLRRLARRKPTRTYCPLCRDLIGMCESLSGLAKEIREKYLEKNKNRHSFEYNHPSRDYPLPWIRGFRYIGMAGRFQATNHSEWAGWRTILWILLLDLCAFAVTIGLNWLILYFDDGFDFPDIIHDSNVQLQSSMQNSVQKTFLERIGHKQDVLHMEKTPVNVAIQSSIIESSSVKASRFMQSLYTNDDDGRSSYWPVLGD